MPLAFVKCVKNGGRVRTVTNKDGTYHRICFINKKAYKGEKRKKKIQ